MPSQSIDFYCSGCKNTIKHNRDELIKNDTSASGLSLMTDIHRCVDGLLKVTNFDVDHQNNIRSYKELEFEDIFKKNNKFGIPSYQGDSTQQSSIFKRIKLSHLPNYKDLRIGYKNYSNRLEIIIGDISIEDEPIREVSSTMKSISFDIYKDSSIGNDEEFENWLFVMANVFETTPPQSLAYLIEILLYCFDNADREPSKMDLATLKAILQSYGMEFVVQEDFNFDNLFSRGNQKFDTKTIGKLMQLLSSLKENPSLSLSHFSKEFDLEMEELFEMMKLLESMGYISVKGSSDFSFEIEETNT